MTPGAPGQFIEKALFAITPAITIVAWQLKLLASLTRRPVTTAPDSTLSTGITGVAGSRRFF